MVVNPVRFRKTGPTIYNVRLNLADVSCRVREIYSGFFRKSNPVKLPVSINGISLYNKITLATKICLAILHQLGARYVEANQGALFEVKGFKSRPLLVLNPPQGSGDARVRTLTFCDAISSLPTNFTDESLTQIFMTVGTSNRGRLCQLFHVLSDDDHDRCLELVKQYHQDRRLNGRQSSHSHSGAPVTSAQTFSSSLAGQGSGMDVNARSFRALLSQPPPSSPPLPSRSPLLSPKRSRRKSISARPGRTSKTSRTAPLKRRRISSSSLSNSRRHKSRSKKKRSRRSPSSSPSSSSGSSSGSGSSTSDS